MCKHVRKSCTLMCREVWSLFGPTYTLPEGLARALSTRSPRFTGGVSREEGTIVFPDYITLNPKP